MVQGGVAALAEQDGHVKVLYATGSYQRLCGGTLDNGELEHFRSSIDSAISEGRSIYADDHFVGFFKSPHGAANLLLIDGPVALSNPDASLIDLYCRNVAIGYENLMLSHEVEDTQRSIIYNLSEAVEHRSASAGNHIRRMAEYSWLLAKAMGLDDEEAAIIRAASPLHDAGKVAIPDAVLNKPGPLTSDERSIMTEHAEIGYEIFKESQPRILKLAATIAKEHHEKWDGSGYPQGLSGESISLAARIVALADVYDALSQSRCYKDSWPQEEVLATIRAGRGSHFDPRVVDAFFRILPQIDAVRSSYLDGNDSAVASG